MLSAKKSLTLALVVPHVLLYALTHALAFIEPKSNKKDALHSLTILLSKWSMNSYTLSKRL